jgi:flavoprotein
MMPGMAISTCAKCEGHVFEHCLITPLRELRAAPVLQCANCGTVVGTLDSEAAIEGLQKQIAAIDAGLVRIIKALQGQ